MDRPPREAWTKKLGYAQGKHKKEAPMGKEIIEFLGVGVRMLKYVRKERKANRVPILDPFHIPSPGPVMGVPLGGIGGGTIGRGFRGDFNRWQYRPGVYHHKSVTANQFSVAVTRKAGTKARVLYPEKSKLPQKRRKKKDPLSSWDWNWGGQFAEYNALYPRAWSTYPGCAGLDEDIGLTCRQVSPFIPNNYKESSYPSAVFVWDVVNTGSTAADVSLMFTWQNGQGTKQELKFEKMLGGHAKRTNVAHVTAAGKDGPEMVGVELKYASGQDDKTNSHNVFIGAMSNEDTDVSYHSNFNTDGNGSEVWTPFSKHGKLGNKEDESDIPKNHRCGAAVNARVNVKPHSTTQVVFVISWDNPVAHFDKASYWRRYTRFYGRDGQAAVRIAQNTLRDYESWEQQIAAWQAPVLNDRNLPDWYKAALFNELYFIADGGTIWTDGEVGDEELLSPNDKDYGHFAYLEGHEYPMYNTYDVHFYASFALTMLFPKLELSLQKDVAAATMSSLEGWRKVIGSGKRRPRKSLASVPHDIGTPSESPWKLVNSYNFQDVCNWKDLNPKFVLQIYRDYIATKDRKFVRFCYEAVRKAMDYASQFDRDGDGLIENEGFPDQTYDAWTVNGISAYSGGLWLAACNATAEMATVCGDAKTATHYRDTFKKGSASYSKALWNGTYFNYDESKSGHANSIMADQLAGEWYSLACNLPPICDEAKASSALRHVYEKNVAGYHRGLRGAVNGMRPNGKVDKSSLQSREVWTGTTYAVAAAMMQEGLFEEGFRTAAGCVHATYEELGYFFQTPEGWDNKGNFRSLAYMRPLSIWAMQWAWENAKEPKGCYADVDCRDAIHSPFSTGTVSEGDDLMTPVFLA